MERNIAVDKNSREYQENVFRSGRSNLILVLVFTVINLVVLLTGSNSYWLFSAAIPYYLTAFGMAFDGVGLDGGGIDGFTITALVISAVILVVYLLSWILSKKRSGWLIVALVLFVLDTLGLLLVMYLLGAGITDFLMDILFHGWVLVYLIRGIMAANKLKNMPEAEEVPEIHNVGPELD